MVAINTVKVGDVLFDVRRVKMGNTTMSHTVAYRVRIETAPNEHGTVMASWNSNPARPMYRRQVERLRRSPPKKATL